MKQEPLTLGTKTIIGASQPILEVQNWNIYLLLHQVKNRESKYKTSPYLAAEDNCS